MLQNAYLVAKIGADTAENEQHFAEILPIGRRVADLWARGRRGGRLLRRAVVHLGGQASPRPHREGSGQSWQGSFSAGWLAGRPAVSKPSFASKCAFESSRRDLHNVLLLQIIFYE